MAAKAELAGIESQVLALAQEQDTISMSGVDILLMQLAFMFPASATAATFNLSCQAQRSVSLP